MEIAERSIHQVFNQSPPPFVADAFCASRLSAEGRRVFGTLPSGCELRAIAERAAPGPIG